MTFISGILDWAHDIKQGIEFARLARSRRERSESDWLLSQSMMQSDQQRTGLSERMIQMAQQRVQMWRSQESQSSPYEMYQRIPFEAYNISFNREEPIEDPNALYSGGRTGHRIVRAADICRKTLGMYTRWDLFYIALRHEEEISFKDFIYLSTDGLSKHDERVIIEGVDLI